MISLLDRVHLTLVINPAMLILNFWILSLADGKLILHLNFYQAAA